MVTMVESSERWPDFGGRIEGERHILPIRVYHEDTDFSGFVYHGSYVRFCERGRSDFVRLLGIGHQELMAGDEGGEPSAFVVRHLELDYRKPARIGELLEVTTACLDIGGATLTLGQNVSRDGIDLVRAKVKIVLVSMSGKPRRLGPLIQGAFQRFVNQ